MIIFTKSDAKTYLKTLIPALQDMDATVFADRFNMFGKIALSELMRERITASDARIIGATYSEDPAPNVGATPAIDTTTGDIYVVPLIAAASKISGDTMLFAIPGEAEFVLVPRVEMADLVLTGESATEIGWWETAGNVNIYIKDGVMTGDPFDFHYQYLYNVVWPSADEDAFTHLVLEDFSGLVQKIAALFRTF
jgi:hypothetical protein